jgi:hypothetical protein
VDFFNIKLNSCKNERREEEKNPARKFIKRISLSIFIFSAALESGKKVSTKLTAAAAGHFLQLRNTK